MNKLYIILILLLIPFNVFAGTKMSDQANITPVVADVDEIILYDVSTGVSGPMALSYLNAWILTDFYTETEIDAFFEGESGGKKTVDWDNVINKDPYATLVSNGDVGTGSTQVAAGDHTHTGVYEPVLGNPAEDGYVLSSTAAGVRSWVASGSGGDNYTVKVDVGATADYIGAGESEGVVRAGTGVTKTDGGDYITLSTNDSEIDHDSLDNYVPNEHIDWTADQGATDINAANIPDLSATYESYLDNPAANDYVLSSTTAGVRSWVAAGAGDVLGPASATDDAIPRFDGTGGKTLKNSTVTIDDSGNIDGDLFVDYTGTPTYTTLQDFIDVTAGVGLITGGTITDDGAGGINIAAGTAIMRTASTDVSDVVFVDFPAFSNVAITADIENRIHVIYNSGSPTYHVQTDDTYLLEQQAIILGSVYKENGNTHIMNTGSHISNFASRNVARDWELYGVQRASGMNIGSTGTRNILLTAGVYYIGNERQTSSSFDTSATDSWIYWYTSDSGANWTKQTGQSQVNNTQYNDITSGLVTLTNSTRYGVMWLYLDYEGAHINAVYGRGDYTLTEATDAQPPTVIPAILSGYSTLVGKVIVAKDSDVLYTYSPFSTTFAGSYVADHNSLTGLQGGTAAEYYHLTSSEHTELHGWLDNVSLGLDGETTLPKLNIDTDGVSFDSSAEGVLDITGLGTGYDEGLTFNFDDVENEVGVSSTTGVTKIDCGTIDIECGDVVATGFTSNAADGEHSLQAHNSTSHPTTPAEGMFDSLGSTHLPYFYNGTSWFRMLLDDTDYGMVSFSSGAGTVEDFALDTDADAGDFDITSIDGLIGIDANVFVDMGVDGVVQIAADTGIHLDVDDETIIFSDGGTDTVNVTTDTGVTKVDYGAIGLATESLSVDASSTASGYVRLLEDSDNGTNYYEVTVPEAIAVNNTFIVGRDRISAQTLTTAGFDVEVDDTLTVYVCTITGLTADRSAVLPAATGSGVKYGFFVLDGDDTYDLLVDPDGTDRIVTTSADGDYIGADDAGDYVELVDIASGYWGIVSKEGTWIEE